MFVHVCNIKCWFALYCSLFNSNTLQLIKSHILPPSVHIQGDRGKDPFTFICCHICHIHITTFKFTILELGSSEWTSRFLSIWLLCVRADRRAAPTHSSLLQKELICNFSVTQNKTEAIVQWAGCFLHFSSPNDWKWGAGYRAIGAVSKNKLCKSK